METELLLTEEFLNDLEDLDRDVQETQNQKIEGALDLKMDEETLEDFKKHFGPGTKDYVEKLKDELNEDGLYEKTLNHVDEIALGAAPDQSRRGDQQAQIMIDANNLITRINQKVRGLHLFLMNVYKEKFEGVETLITTAFDYARCIIRIGHKRVRFDSATSNSEFFFQFSLLKFDFLFFEQKFQNLAKIIQNPMFLLFHGFCLIFGRILWMSTSATSFRTT